MSKRIRASVLLAALTATAGLAAPAGAVPPGPNGEPPRPSTATGATVPAPAVTGPIARTSPVGDAAHGYPFLASDVDLAKAGYVEEEYLISGQANRYTITGTNTATVLSSGHPYSTRIVVRRPAAAAKFNGTVIAEWINVSNQWDQEVDWFQSHEHFLREGYVWVGVSAQRAGLHSATGLKLWSPTRYGALDVTAANTINDDSLSYDIFSQAVKAVRSPAGLDPLGPLAAPDYVIATGHSQSAGRLRTYANSIQPLSNILDATVLHGGGGAMRTDRRCRSSASTPRATSPAASATAPARRLADVPQLGGRGRVARRLEADHRLRPAAQARHRHLPGRLPRRAADVHAAVALARPAAHGPERALRPHVQLGRVRDRAAVGARDQHDDAHRQHRRRATASAWPRAASASPSRKCRCASTRARTPARASASSTAPPRR